MRKVFVCRSVYWGWIWISQWFRELTVEDDCSTCVCVCVRCMMFLLSSECYRACVSLSSCHPEVNMKDWMGLWNLLSGLYVNATHTDTSTKGACGETHSNTHTNTNRWRENSHLHLVGVWSLIKLHLAPIVYSLRCSSLSPQSITHCHFLCVCVVLQLLSNIFK